MCQLNPQRFRRFLALNNLPEEDNNRDGNDPAVFMSHALGLDDATLRRYKMRGGSTRPGPLTREELRQRCDVARSDDALRGAILSILAWGGMKPQNLRGFWRSGIGFETLIELIRKMRVAKLPLDPVEAFSWFKAERQAGHLPFMRISFYTKILFFFFPGHPTSEAPILDQFVAKSINALFDGNPIPMDGDFPSDTLGKASACNAYRRYLKCLDILRERLAQHYRRSFSRGEVEYCIFRPGPWRDHVTGLNRQ